MHVSNKSTRGSTLTQSTFNPSVDDMTAHHITPTVLNIRGSQDTLSKFLEHWKKQHPLQDNPFP